MSSININSSDSDSDSDNDEDGPVHPTFEQDFQLNVPDKKDLIKGPVSETLNSKEPISKKPSSSGKTTGLEDVSTAPPTVHSSTNDDDEHHRSFAESFSQHVPDKHPFPTDKMPALEDVSQVHPPHGADNLARTRSLVLPPPPEETSVEFRSVPNLSSSAVFKEEETQSSPGMRKKGSSLKDATQPKPGYGKSRTFLSDASQPNPGSRKTRSMNIENTTSADMLIDEAAIKVPSPDKLIRDAPGSANLKTTTGADMIVDGAAAKSGATSTGTGTVFSVRGWGDSNHVTVRHVPKNHARRKKFEANDFRIERLNEVASAIKTCIVELSFQAVFSGTPLVAKVQTADLCEFFVDFWLSKDGKMFYIDFQRRKGDGIVATKHMQVILRAAKEGFDEKSIE
eukprot:scaffold1046_cov66-Cylindrotheca_fusiformis.AAC.1